MVVGNSGPTIARNVKVTVEPGLPAGQQQSEKIERVQRTLANGLRSLAPGRVLRWSLGAGFDLLSSDVPPNSARYESKGTALTDRLKS